MGYDTDTRYWKQSEIRQLITYATQRGVRLVPEIEMSTHAKALLPLVRTQVLQFCNESFPVMLFDDAAGKTFNVLKRLLTEMAGLFPDAVIHTGIYLLEWQSVELDRKLQLCLTTSILTLLPRQVWMKPNVTTRCNRQEILWMSECVGCKRTLVATKRRCASFNTSC